MRNIKNLERVLKLSLWQQNMLTQNLIVKHIFNTIHHQDLIKQPCYIKLRMKYMFIYYAISLLNVLITDMADTNRKKIKFVATDLRF